MKANEPTQTELDQLKEKIEYVTRNIERITKVNGYPIYSPLIRGNLIWYNLKPENPEHRTYYYPIQYANIEFK